MRSRWQRSVLLLSLIALLFSAAAIALEYWPSPNEIEWMTLDVALERAKETESRVYVDVYADWCVPCRRMDREVFQNDTVRSILQESIIPVRVNLDSEMGQRLTREFAIAGVPTSLILNHQGQEAKRRVGGMSARQFLTWLRDPVESVFASWQPYVFAKMTAEESRRPLLVLAMKDKGNFESLEQAFKKSSTREFIGKSFVPALLIESVEQQRAVLESFGSTVIQDQTAGTLLVFEDGVREIARIPLTMQMLWSEAEFIQALLPYTESSVMREPSTTR